MGMIFFILSLSACCGKQMVANLVDSDNLKIDASSKDENTFKVYINASRDCLCDFDGNRKEDRLRVINILFEEKCKSIEVLDEQYVTLMLYNAWATKIKCRP